MVFPSSKYYEPLMAEVCWIKRSQQECSWWVLHSILWICQFYLLHGLSGRNMLNSFDILIHASTTQKDICSFELSLFSRIPIFIYQLIVRSNCAFMLSMLIILVVSQAFYSGWLGETNSSTSSISRIGSKQLYSADQNATQLLTLFYLGVLPS